MAWGYLTDQLRTELPDLASLETSKKHQVRHRVRARVKHMLDDLAFSAQHIPEDLTHDAFDPAESLLPYADRRFGQLTLIDAVSFLLGQFLIHRTGQRPGDDPTDELEELITAALRRHHDRYHDEFLTDCTVEISYDSISREAALDAATDKVGTGRRTELSEAESQALINCDYPDADPDYDEYTTTELPSIDPDAVLAHLEANPEALRPGFSINTIEEQRAEYELHGEDGTGQKIIVRIAASPTNQETVHPIRTALKTGDADQGIIVGPNSPLMFNRLSVRFFPTIEYYATHEMEDTLKVTPVSSDTT